MTLKISPEVHPRRFGCFATLDGHAPLHMFRCGEGAVHAQSK
jgi:hypothetical protein